MKRKKKIKTEKDVQKFLKEYLADLNLDFDSDIECKQFLAIVRMDRIIPVLTFNDKNENIQNYLDLNEKVQSKLGSLRCNTDIRKRFSRQFFNLASLTLPFRYISAKYKLKNLTMGDVEYLDSIFERTATFYLNDGHQELQAFFTLNDRDDKSDMLHSQKGDSIEVLISSPTEYRNILSCDVYNFRNYSIEKRFIENDKT